MTDCTNEVYTKNKIELVWLSDQVRSLTKTKHKNDVIDHIGMVYAKIEIELSGPI